jgi:hypothetical protein
VQLVPTRNPRPPVVLTAISRIHRLAPGGLVELDCGHYLCIQEEHDWILVAPNYGADCVICSEQKWP